MMMSWGPCEMRSETFNKEMILTGKILIGNLYRTQKFSLRKLILM